MDGSKRLLKGTVVLTLGRVASYGLAFARNVILARILTKADFGLAAVFGMTISLLEVAAQMSFGQQIVQSKDGNSIPFQATSHAFQFSLSVVGSLLILGLSYPLAVAFKVPENWWGFALLAVVPLARGFEHLDYCRQQRELNYLPAVLCDCVPQLVVTMAAWPLLVWLGDFRVIVWLMVVKAVTGVLMTHLLAERPYLWAWHQTYVKSMWLFGWPLLLNGLLIFASQQADHVLVGTSLSLDDLAAYALAFSLVSIPWFIFAQVGSSLMLPVLSRAQDDKVLFRSQYQTCVEYAGVVAVLLTLPMIVFGEQMVRLLYGPKYHGAGMLMAILGTASAVRFLRFAPAIASLARADTINQLYSNCGRGVSLPLAATVVVLGGGVALIASCAVVGELLAAIISLNRLRNRQGIPLRTTAGSAAYVIGFLAFGFALVCVGTSRWGHWLAAVGTLAVLGFPIVAAWIAFPSFSLLVRSACGRKWLVAFQRPAAGNGR